MKVKTNYAVSILALGEGLLGKLTPPLALLQTLQAAVLLGWVLGWVSRRILEGRRGDRFSFPSNCPARAVHNCDFLPQLLSLASEAIIQFLLGGHQRGWPTRRYVLGVANLSTEVLNHWTRADVVEVPGCG